MLRAEGLASDRLGDAMVFFRLSHTEAHYTLCSCIHGQSMKAGEAARRLRNIAPPLFDLRDISPRDLLPVWIAGTGLAGIMVVSALLHLLS